MHSDMGELIQASPFMLALGEGRYDELAQHFPGFKKLIGGMSHNKKVEWHEVHLALLFAEEEIMAIAEDVKDSARKFVKRAIHLLKQALIHVRLMIVHNHTSSSAEEEESDKFLRCLAKKGKLKKIDIVMLGHAIHEKAFADDNEVTVVEICVGLGKFFGMNITEAYVRSAFTDIRNQYQSDNKLFIETLCEVFIGKIHRAIEKSNKLYDKKLREEKLKARK